MIQLATFYHLARLHDLIAKGRRGNAAQLAKLLNQSERNVYRCLALLRELGAPLKFCYLTSRYLYESDWELPWAPVPPPPGQDLTIY
jgi:hypothetical protein